MISVCFTGHRPQKLGGWDWMNEKNLSILKELRLKVIYLIENESATNFIFGGAIGIDQMAFAVVLKLKKEKYSNIKLTIAVPFKNQWIKWRIIDVEKYKKQLTNSDKVVYVDELINTRYSCTLAGVGNYHRDKMQIRNEYMVDNSDFVVAVWDGTKGGTCNCVRYALEKGLKFDESIIRINPRNH